MPVIDSPGFGHTFVPIDSLTSSPRSSTVSTSVLEWNSNSGSEINSSSEGFSVRSLDNEQFVQSNPTTPDIPTFSPEPPSLKTSLPDDDQTFASFNSAAPVADSASNTVTSDTYLYHNLLSALDERLTLQDSVTQWQNHSYRETAGLDNRPDSPSDLGDDVHDKPHTSSAPSPNRSLATESSVSAVTAKPSLHVSSLFLPPSPPAPPAPPQVYPPSPSVVSNQTQSESISIAQYFQLKAANAEEPGPVQPQVLRPISAASCLSYASSAQTPVAVPLPDRSTEAPLLHQTWQDLLSKVDKHLNPATAYSPPTRARRCGYRPRTSQMEDNNTGSQLNPFITKVIPPSLQGSNALGSNLKSHAPSRPAWTPPAITHQFEPITLKPIVIRSSPTNIHDRPQASVTNINTSLNGKTPGKSTNPPVPPSSRDVTSVAFSPNGNQIVSGSQDQSVRVYQSSPYSIFNCQGSDLPSWFGEPPIRISREASPESIDSVLPPPLSTPSVSSPTRRGSPGSPISAIPPSPTRVELQPPYLRHPTPSNAPYVPLTPPAPPLNGAYSTTQRTSRALPIPSISRTFGSHTQAPYTPRYTDSTLPRDMHLSAAPPTPWGPTPRRLRFAPLPPTPSAGLHYTGAPGCTQPYPQPYPAPLYTAPLTPYPLNPMPYPYHAQAPVPQTPAPISTPYSSWRYGATGSSPPWTPHHVFWYSDGSIIFRVCHSFKFFRR